MRLTKDEPRLEPPRRVSLQKEPGQDVTAPTDEANPDLHRVCLPHETFAAFSQISACMGEKFNAWRCGARALLSRGAAGTPGQPPPSTLLAEIATLGGATNLVNAPAWPGNITWDLLAGTITKLETCTPSLP